MTTPLIPYQHAYLQRAGTGAFPHVSEEEAKRMIESAPTIQSRLILSLLWYTGARVSELCALRVSDLNLANSTLTIRRLKRRKEFLQEFPIPDYLANELKMFVKLKKRSGKIFSADRYSVHDMVARVGWKALQKKVSPRHFRHGRAYDMVKRGIHPMLVSRALGHAQISSALSYYHPTREDLREALKSI